MRKCRFAFVLIAAMLSLVFAGCVERTLTINSNPSDATVVLNDEEVGQTPVTVSFNWYGDYNVRLIKPGYQTLATHKELKGPWYDKFPFDFFAGVLNPFKIVNSHQWAFDLQQAQPANTDELIKKAQDMKQQLNK